MIDLLIYLLVLVLFLGVVVWVINLIALPEPYGRIAIAIVALIFLLLLLSMLLGAVPLRPLLR